MYIIDHFHFLHIYNCSSFAVWQRGSLPCQPRIFQWDFSTCRHFPHQVFSSPTPTPPLDWHCFEPPSSILMNECHEVSLILIVFTCSLAFTITWQFAQFVLLIQVMKISVYPSDQAHVHHASFLFTLTWFGLDSAGSLDYKLNEKNERFEISGPCLIWSCHSGGSWQGSCLSPPFRPPLCHALCLVTSSCNENCNHDIQILR